MIIKKLLLMIMLSIPATSFAAFSASYMDIEGDVAGVVTEYSWGEGPWEFSAGVLFGSKDYSDCYGAVCSVVTIDPSAVVRTTYSPNETFFMRLSVLDFQATAGAAGYGRVFIETVSSTEAGVGFGFNMGKVSLAFDFFDDANTWSLAYNF